MCIRDRANLDNRSFRLNFEVAVAIYGSGPADELAAQLAVDARRASRVTVRRLASRPLPMRFAESAARLFAAIL